MILVFNKNNGADKCQNIVNKTKHDLCQFHAAQQYKKYASKRNDTNRSSLSSKLRNRTKKSLSKLRSNNNRNGITMYQIKKPQNHNISNINNSNRNRKKNANVHHPIYSRNANKNTLTIEQNKKRKTMNKLLSGKPLLPHLGTNWNNRNNTRNGNIILGPKKNINNIAQHGINQTQSKTQKIMQKKAIKFEIPDPNNYNNNNLRNRNHRKRSFECMNRSNNNNKNQNPSPIRKRHRLSNIVNTNMDEIINRKSINDHLRVEMEKENVMKELNNLENEEKLHDQLCEITSVQVQVYICKHIGCPLKEKVYEKPNDFCKSHSMNITKSTGRKYFWKCDNCQWKTYTLNTKRVRAKCYKCGKRKFKEASAYNTDKSKLKTNASTKTLILVNNKRK